MSNVKVGINLEYVRHSDKSFEWAVEKAAKLGFEYVEPMVHWGRELLSAAGYFHSISLLSDPLYVRRICDENGVKISGLSAHSPLCKPDISTDYLRQAVRFAAECGAPVVNTDDGPKPIWTTEQEDLVLMKYVLNEVAAVAEPRSVWIGLETHGQYTCTPAALARVLELVSAASVGINFDTGNSFLSGNDPLEWLSQVIDRVVSLHAKDISQEAARLFRGKVKGMLGCACGDGVIDWRKVVAICKRANREIVLSVECGSIEDAERSLHHLRELID
jgi:sugar phosphate isomerase/epimerase